jgi:hypothetical protein
MSLEKINDQFLRMEDELDLFNQKIDNVYFWEKIRVKIFDQISRVTITSGQSNPKRKYKALEVVKTGIHSIKNIIIKNPYLSSQKDILFIGHSRRRLHEDGKWWDIYCDPIIENLDKSYVLTEYPYLFTHLKPVKTSNIRYLDFFVFSFVLQRFLRIKRVHFSKEEKFLIEKIQNEIYTKFRTKININELLKTNLLLRKTFLPLFIRLLKRIRPKLIILVISYNVVNEALCEASKKLNIPVIELQHGVLNSYHYGYSYPEAKRKKHFFVDYFFAFGSFWRDSTEFPIEKERIFCVGYPYFEKVLKKYKNVPKKDKILFISPGYPLGKAFSQFALEFSEKSLQNCEIVYKLHPGEYHDWKKNYPWLVNSNIQVIDNEAISIYQLFAESKIQVGVSSTAIYEGLMFGLRTYIINMFGIEYMEFLIESGAVKMILSVDELEESITTEKNLPEVNPDIFFKKDALNNIYEKIDELIASHTDSSKHTQSLGKKNRS